MNDYNTRTLVLRFASQQQIYITTSKKVWTIHPLYTHIVPHDFAFQSLMWNNVSCLLFGTLYDTSHMSFLRQGRKQDFCQLDIVDQVGMHGIRLISEREETEFSIRWETPWLILLQSVAMEGNELPCAIVDFFHQSLFRKEVSQLYDGPG
jgi:hypothetical protein